MRIAAIADVHVGNHRRFGGPMVAGLNRRCSQIIAALKLACESAAREKCDALVICGDLFDGVRPEPQVIAAVQHALFCGPPVTYIIKGNHDSVSDLVGDHALGPLDMDRENGWIVVQDQPSWYPLGHSGGDKVDLLFVPFQAGSATEWLPKALDAVMERPGPHHAGCATALFLHLGIEDQKTAEFLKGAADSIPAETLADWMIERKIRAAFCGNWHDARQWSLGGKLADPHATNIFQVGALCPTGFDNPGPDYGRMVIWDTEANTAEHLCIPGPRFLKMRAVSRAIAQGLVKDGCSVYVSISTDLDSFPIAEAAFESLLADGVIVDGEISLDSGEAEIAARDAAQAARGASTLQESLAGFVKEMQLPDGVDRAEVLAKAQAYLKG